MSLTLQESCQLYERHARRNKAVPTFAAFNTQHFTCLPSNPKVQGEFLTAVVKARKEAGLPIRGRLFSLYRRLTKTEVSAVAQKVEAVPSPAVNSFAVSEPKYEKAMRMSIRPPAAVQAAPAAVPESPEPERWTMAAYVEAVQASGLAEPKGLMVHFVPETKELPLSSLASKLTKTTWDAIRGKSADTSIKMKDGIMLDMSTFELNQEDVTNFVRNRKKKVQGPYFIRFSSI